MEAIGERWGLPVASVRVVLRRVLHASLSGPMPTVCANRLSNGTQQHVQGASCSVAMCTYEFIKDYTHPTLFGHTFYAHIVEAAILQAASLNRAGGVQRDAQLLLSSHCVGVGSGRGHRLCAFGDALRSHVLKTSGWVYVVEHSQEGNPKPGYVASTPGATLTICHSELVHAAGLQAGRERGHGVGGQLQLGLLKSYEAMGEVRALWVGLR